ncbi:hypothetical protein TNCV_2401431 [Trichonephila clavipes]|nr:hypothetical protein TNCV_2401431 [Trichonephila clavipes]
MVDMTRLVTKWVWIRIPIKALLYLLREKKSDFHLQWIAVPNGISTSLILFACEDEMVKSSVVPCNDMINEALAIRMPLVYADKPQTLDLLEDNIRRVIADIRPQMLEKVIENWTSRLDYMQASRGSPMPEIIFKM